MELGDGVIGILGQNGTGKSSLVEAIAWAIYGNESSILRNGKEGVKRSGALPNDECQVVVEFDLEGDAYRLVRSIRGKNSLSDAALMVNEKVVAKGDRAVTDAMVKRLGMDHKAFFISVFARQKELNALSSLRPAERKKLILRMLGVDVLDEVVDAISKDTNSVKTTLNALGSVLVNEDGRERMAVLRDEIERLVSERVAVIPELEASGERMKGLEARVLVAKGRMEAAEARYARFSALDGRKASLVSDSKNLASRKQKAAADLMNLEEKAKALDALGDVESAYASAEGIKEAMDEMRAKHSQLASLRQMIAQKSGQLPALRSEVEALEKEAAALGDPEQTARSAEEAIEAYRQAESAHRERANMALDEVRRTKEDIASKEVRIGEMRRLGPESECPMCERKLEHQHGFLLDKVSKEIAKAREAIKELEAARSAADEAARKAVERRSKMDERRKEALRTSERQAELRRKASISSAAITTAEEDISRASKQIALIGNVEFDPAAYEGVKRQMSELRPKVDAAIRLRSELQRRPAIEKDLQDIDEKAKATAGSLASVAAEMDALCFRKEELSEGRDAYTKARDDKDEELRKASFLKGEVSRLDAGVSAGRARMAELEADARKAEVLRKRQVELNVLLTVMKEFRSNVMARVVPTLSKTSSELFNELTEGRFGGMELDDDYEVHIFDGGEKYPLGRFSGGESDLANLSLRLAISMMIAERSGRHVNLLVLDEIFGSQDNVRKRSILELLSKLQRQFAQIMVITHIEDVKDAVDDLIVVRETADGCSQLGRVE